MSGSIHFLQLLNSMYIHCAIINMGKHVVPIDPIGADCSSILSSASSIVYCKMILLTNELVHHRCYVTGGRLTAQMTSGLMYGVALCDCCWTYDMNIFKGGISQHYLAAILRLSLSLRITSLLIFSRARQRVAESPKLRTS